MTPCILLTEIQFISLLPQVHERQGISYWDEQDDELGPLWKQFLLVPIIFQVADFRSFASLYLTEGCFAVFAGYPMTSFIWVLGLTDLFPFMLWSVHNLMHKFLGLLLWSDPMMLLIPTPPCGCAQKYSISPAQGLTWVAKLIQRS